MFAERHTKLGSLFHVAKGLVYWENMFCRTDLISCTGLNVDQDPPS